MALKMLHPSSSAGEGFRVQGEGSLLRLELERCFISLSSAIHRAKEMAIVVQFR